MIDNGRLVALGPPDELKRDVGGDVVTIEVPDGDAAVAEIVTKYGIRPTVDGETVRFSVAGGEAFLPDFIRSFSQSMNSVSLRRLSLDVFLHLTGHDIEDADAVSDVDAGVTR